jgi:hypothetical protein
MSKLKAVKPKTVEPSKAKVLVFGEAGVGKTFFSLDFPQCFFIDAEGGASRAHYTDKLEKAQAMYLGIEQGAQDFNEVIEQAKALATEKHSYKTLVIDSITKLFNNEIAKEMERLGDKDAFGASKKPAVAKTRKLLNWLDKLDMNVILIAHESKEWANEKQIGVKADAWEKMAYELDLVLNIKKQGDSRKAFIKKSRLQGFPDGGSFELSYDEFAKRYGKDVIEAAVKPVTLATPEQLAEIAGLLENWKAPEGWTDKTFTAAKVERWADMSNEQISTSIAFIKTKLTTTGEK